MIKADALSQLGAVLVTVFAARMQYRGVEQIVDVISGDGQRAIALAGHVAAVDGDHRATIGIYSGLNQTGLLGRTVVDATGYSIKPFTLPSAITVLPGQKLYLAVTGIGDVTVYDNAAGCIIGTVRGTL